MNIAEFLKKENIFEFASLKWQELRVIGVSREKALFEKFVPKTVVIFLMPYYVNDKKTNISRYSKSHDYHLYVRELSRRAESELDREFFLSSDVSPIDEVNAALCAGLGCVGENGLLINQTYGSYVFIGEFFFATEIEDSFFEGTAKKNSPQKCLGCGACRKACLTGGIDDRKFCVSYINQKKKITDDEREIIKKSGLVWGCDECQEVCPMNCISETPIEFFKKERIEMLTNKKLSELIEAKDFENRAFAWRGEETLRRNLDIFENETTSR